MRKCSFFVKNVTVPIQILHNVLLIITFNANKCKGKIFLLGNLGKETCCTCCYILSNNHINDLNLFYNAACTKNKWAGSFMRFGKMGNSLWGNSL